MYLSENNIKKEQLVYLFYKGILRVINGLVFFRGTGV